MAVSGMEVAEQGILLDDRLAVLAIRRTAMKSALFEEKRTKTAQSEQKGTKSTRKMPNI